MLFGRKTPPAPPKADSAAPAQPAGRPHGAGDAGGSLSPLASLNNPAPMADPAMPSPVMAGASAPSMAHALSDAQHPVPGAHAHPAYPDTPSASKGPDMTSIPKPPTAPSVPGAGFKTDVPRRVVDMPGAAPRQPSMPIATPAQAAQPAPAPVPMQAAPVMPEQRRLTVGRDIVLSGEIGSCDVLVVEGTVEAKLREGRSIEISDGGLFKGSVEIDEADIGGRFEGDIAVRGRLTVRTTGKITGSIRFGELAVEAGGQLVGDIQLYSAAKPVQATVAAVEPVPAPAEAV